MPRLGSRVRVPFSALFFILQENNHKSNSMNLYLRYFDREVLVKTVDEAIAFLSEIDEVGMNHMLEADIRDYVASDVAYPKRYKIRPRVYFIIIKTDAATMEDFKEKRSVREVNAPKAPAAGVLRLNEEHFGWYEGQLDFKRVALMPGTGKFQYRDTRFVARCKAYSGLDCYNRIVDHLSQRVDRRSQFPSSKGKNFKFTFLGECK